MLEVSDAAEQEWADLPEDRLTRFRQLLRRLVQTPFEQWQTFDLTQIREPREYRRFNLRLDQETLYSLRASRELRLMMVRQAQQEWVIVGFLKREGSHATGYARI